MTDKEQLLFSLFLAPKSCKCSVNVNLCEMFHRSEVCNTRPIQYQNFLYFCTLGGVKVRSRFWARLRMTVSLSANILGCTWLELVELVEIVRATLVPRPRPCETAGGQGWPHPGDTGPGRRSQGCPCGDRWVKCYIRESDVLNICTATKPSQT